MLGGLTFLGGQGGGDSLRAGMMLDLRCRPSAIVLVDVSDGTVRCELAADDLPERAHSALSQVRAMTGRLPE